MNCLFYGKARVSRGFAKLKEDFGLADSAVTKAFIKVKTVSSEMFIRSFQFLSFRSSLILESVSILGTFSPTRLLIMQNVNCKAYSL